MRYIALDNQTGKMYMVTELSWDKGNITGKYIDDFNLFKEEVFK